MFIANSNIRSLFSIFTIAIALFYGLYKPLSVGAIYDPMPVTNNKVGIHILDPNEVEKAADLVNSSGGDWGYVTVPLRTDDRDREKWLKFFKRCQEDHLIPIIRLAAVMNSSGWSRPNLYDSLDTANFLNDIPWPVKNRYIVVYNEPNHALEWDGAVDPVDYAMVLKYTSLIFKQRNEDFFILPAGLDAAAPTNLPNHENIYNFISRMHLAFPDVFEHIDGWTSHSYPNPGFLGTPSDNHNASISGFNYEINFLKKFTNKNLPIFITETGWNQQRVGEEKAADYFRNAYDNVWNNDQIVAVTPFLLLAGDGDFKKFSFLKPDGSESKVYFALKNMAKPAGLPKLAEKTLFAQVLGAKGRQEEKFSLETQKNKKGFNLPVDKWKKIFSWIWYTLN